MRTLDRALNKLKWSIAGTLFCLAPLVFFGCVHTRLLPQKLATRFRD